MAATALDAEVLGGASGGRETVTHHSFFDDTRDVRINNAVLHGLEGRERGTIVIAARQLDRRWIELSVSDDGCGIPAADRSRVFDPFFTTKLGRGGSGLGLNISYNLVTQVLGGSIDVHSQPGEGSRLSLRLPVTAP